MAVVKVDWATFWVAATLAQTEEVLPDVALILLMAVLIVAKLVAAAVTWPLTKAPFAAVQVPALTSVFVIVEPMDEMDVDEDKSIVVPALTVDAKAVKAAIPAVALDIEVSVPVAAEAST